MRISHWADLYLKSMENEVGYCCIPVSMCHVYKISIVFSPPKAGIDFLRHPQPSPQLLQPGQL